MGQFIPAPVQREYQWTTRQAADLLDDLFGAFARLGLDPDAATIEPAELAIGEDDAEDVDTDGEHESYAEPAGDDTGDSLSLSLDDDEPESGPLEEAPLDEPVLPGKLQAARVIGRGRRRPPPVYNLNAIVLLRAPQTPDRFYLYDGLQRFVTLTILLAKLRHGAADPMAAFCQATDRLLFTDPGAGSRRLLVPTSGQSLAAITAGRTPPQRNLTLGDTRMRDVANFLNGRLRAWSDLRRDAFVSFLCDRVVLSVQVLEDVSLAFQTFVTANDRGLRLEIGDVLKGEFVERANELRATVEELDEIASGWRRLQGQLRGGFKDFLPAVETLKFGMDEQYAPGERLIALFDQAQGPGEIAGWIEAEFSEMAEIFRRSRAHYALLSSSGIDLSFRQLSLLGWKEWQPVCIALGLAHGDQINEHRWTREISALCRFCFTVELIGWTRERRRRFRLALEQLQSGQNPLSEKTRSGHDGALYLTQYWRDIARRKLRRPFIDFEQRGTIVRWIEMQYWGASVPRSCTDDASIEHVVPVAITSDWSRRISEKDYDAWSNSLGNLCLLPRHINEQLSNRSWEVKAAEYENHRSRFRTVESVLQAGRRGWSASAIRNRTLAMAARASRALQLEPVRGRR